MEKQQKKIYMSFPISGYDLDERKETAMKMQVHLHGAGYDVFNPLENGLPTTATTNEHMKRDLEALLTCDAIFLMRGWNRSAGCHTEFTVAVACGLDVWFEERVNTKL